MIAIATASSEQTKGARIDMLVDIDPIRQHELWRGIDRHYYLLQQHLGRIAGCYCDSTYHTPHLEIGCGVGSTTKVVYRNTGRPIHALERNPLLVEAAIKQLDRVSGLVVPTDAVNFLRACEPESYSLAFSALTLHESPPERQLEVFQMLYRSLTPGGVFLFGDRFIFDHRGYQNQVKTRLEAIVSLAQRNPRLCLAWHDHELVETSNTLTIGRASRMLTQAGFHDIFPTYRTGIYGIIAAHKA